MIFDITPFLCPEDKWPAEVGIESVLRCYDEKYRLALLLQPTSILEFGVRAGYAAAAFLSACPEAEYAGIDSDVDGMLLSGEKMLLAKFPGRRMRLQKYDTLGVNRVAHFEMIHVDANHTNEGALHELRLALTAKPKWIVVDDMDCLPVRLACEEFLRETGLRSIELPTFRGDLVIQCS